MGFIRGMKSDGKGEVSFDVVMSYEESLSLKGHTKNIHVFSEDTPDITTHLSERGHNGSTKYFLIPKELRGKMRFSKGVKCQKISTKTKEIFIFVVKKDSKK